METRKIGFMHLTKTQIEAGQTWGKLGGINKIGRVMSTKTMEIDRLSTSNGEMQVGMGTWEDGKWEGVVGGDLFQTRGRVMNDVGIESYMKPVALRRHHIT